VIPFPVTFCKGGQKAMKISEMTNDQAAEAMIRLAVPFGNICEDEEAVKLIEDYKGMGDKPVLYTIGKMLPQLTAYMFKKHKTDLYEIVGALTFTKVSAVAKMNFIETVNILRDSYDEVLKGFFTSSVKQMSNTAKES
jgi:hypothetical protein